MRRPRPCSRRPRGCSPSSSCAPATPPPCTRPAGAARRVVEEARERLAAALGAPAQRGGLDRRRHRGGQPRGQGAVLGPAQRGPARRRRGRVGAVEHHAVLDPAFWLAEHDGRGGGAPAGRRRRGCSTSTRCATSWSARRPGRAGHGDVGEQRGRHAAAARRRGRARARRTACPCTPTPSRRSGQVPVDFAAAGWTR